MKMDVDGGDESHKLDFPNLPESEEVKVRVLLYKILWEWDF